MANWYYARDGEQQGPVTLDELREVLARRIIGPTDLVWADGMSEWVEAQSVGALSPASASPRNDGTVRAGALEVHPAMAGEPGGAAAAAAHADFALKPGIAPTPPVAPPGSPVAPTPPPVINPPLAGPMPVLPLGVPPPGGWPVAGQGYPQYGAPMYGQYGQQPYGQPPAYGQQGFHPQQPFTPTPSKGTPVWVWFLVGGGVLLVLILVGSVMMVTSKATQARQAAQRVQAQQTQRQAQLAAQQRANANAFTAVAAPGSRFNGTSSYLTGTVQADEGWQAVRELTSGQRVTFSTAIGVWNTQPRSSLSSPSSNRRPVVALDSRFPANALIGRIGTQQFLVNSGVSVNVDQDGLLELRINEADGGLFDNSGSKSVTLRMAD